MKRYIKCSNVIFPLDIYEFLDWFNARNPDYRIYNDDIDLVSCDYSSNTLARFPIKLKVSESEAKALEQKLLDAMHKQEADVLSGNIDFDGYIEPGLRDYLVKHVNELDDETACKLIDHLYSSLNYSSYYRQLSSLAITPGLSKAVIDKLKSNRFTRHLLAAYNPDLSDKERIELLILEVDEVLQRTDAVSCLDFLKRDNYVPDEVLRYVVLNAKQPRVRAVVARRPNLSPDIVDMLKNDKSVVVRRVIDKNYN